MTKDKLQLRESFLTYFMKESELCSQHYTHLTADSIGIILEFIDSYANEFAIDQLEKLLTTIENEQVSQEDGGGMNIAEGIIDQAIRHLKEGE